MVGIHGIGKTYDTGPELEPEWGPAIAGGLREAGFREQADRVAAELRVASYGSLFRREGVLNLGPPRMTADDLSSQAERDWITTLYEAAVAEEPTLAPAPGSLVATPVSLKALVHKLLQSPAFAGVSESLLVGSLRQVVAYLNDEKVRARVHERVQAEVSDDTTVLIGHSLGSVVAHQFLTAGHGPDIRLLVTLGSPLGISNLVFDKLRPAPMDGRGAWPGGVERWVNVVEPHDFVAMVTQLRPLFGPGPDGAQVEDIGVSNGWSAHSVKRYLNPRAVGEVLGPWL